MTWRLHAGLLAASGFCWLAARALTATGHALEHVEVIPAKVPRESRAEVIRNVAGQVKVRGGHNLFDDYFPDDLATPEGRAHYRQIRAEMDREARKAVIDEPAVEARDLGLGYTKQSNTKKEKP